MTVLELRKASGMTQKAFAEYFGMSKRAVENWEGGKRECPIYLLELMEYKLHHENMLSVRCLGVKCQIDMLRKNDD